MWESETGAGDPLAPCNPTHGAQQRRVFHTPTHPLKWALGLSPEGNQDLSPSTLKPSPHILLLLSPSLAGLINFKRH